MNNIATNNKLRADRTFCFSMCWAAYCLAYMCRMNFSMTIPFITSDIPALAEKTGLIASCFFFSYACGQLVCGHLGDRYRPERMIFIGLLFSSCANLAFGFARSFVPMALLWTLNGCFQSMLWGPIIRIISTVFAENAYNRVTPILMLSTVIGYLLTWSLAGYVSEQLSWTYAMWIPGTLLLCFSLLWALLSPRLSKAYTIALQTKQRGQSRPTQNGPLLSTRKILKEEKLQPIVFASFCQGVVKDGIGLWAPAYFLAKYGFTFSKTIGFILLIPCANALGILFAGWLNARFHYQERKTALILFGMTLFILGASILLPTAGILITAICIAAASGLSHGTNSMLLSYLPLKCSKYGKSSAIAGLMDFSSYMGVAVSSMILGVFMGRGDIDLLPVAWLLSAAMAMLLMRISYKQKTAV